MSERLALVTGSSSGIGAAAVRALLERGWRVVGMARRSASFDSPDYRHLALDLADVPAASAAIERELAALVGDGRWQRVGLVNNAAVGLAGRVQLADPEELTRSFALNAAMPLWLMGFLARARPKDVLLRIVNVSSGAAVRAFPGLAAYCASKAALRMAGMTVALELDSRVSVLSYEPGVVDTEMQAATRSKSREEFPWVETFHRYHSEGLLAAPELPAADIVKFLDSDDLERFAERRRGA